MKKSPVTRRGPGKVPAVYALILCLLLNPLAFSQTPQVEKVDLQAVGKIRSEGMDRSQVMDILGHLTDVIGPRLTGSPGMKAANEWTRDKMAGWGMQNAHLEKWGPFGRGWSMEKFSMHMVTPQYAPLIAYPKAWTPGLASVVKGDAVLAEIKTVAELEQYRGRLKGAIVFIAPAREVKAQFKSQGERLDEAALLKLANADTDGGDTGGRVYTEDAIRRRREATELARVRDEFFRTEMPALVVEPSRSGSNNMGDGGTVFVQSGGSRDKNALQAPPTAVMAVEHYNRIVRLLQKGVKVSLEVDYKAKFHDEDPMQYNTIAEIPGTDKSDEIVMLGGHLDSWHAGTGATDNAAGCAVAMEAVRILQTLGLKPRRTIRVALWSGEEQGLRGSRAYVSEHFASRPAPPPGAPAEAGYPRRESGPLTIKPEHGKLSVYFNLDNGTGKIRGIYLQGNDAVRPIFREWFKPFRDLGASTLTFNNTGGTDHQAFDGVGLPGFQFIQDEVEYETRTHHSNMDVLDRIQADDMKQAATIMAAFVYLAAMRDDLLPRKPMPATPVARSGAGR
ncbi:MAG: M20/M25/M40 family metallo-hydrolase [Blastocatellia bacterium]